MHILILTTSFPLSPGNVSGVFLKRLICHFPNTSSYTVLTPDNPSVKPQSCADNIAIKTFIYAPRFCEILAHKPGGIPAALNRNKLLYLIVPVFLIAMFFATLRHANRKSLIYANWSICGVIAGIVGYLLHIPVVTTLRGGDVARIHSSIIYRWLIKASLILNHSVVTVSDAFNMQLTKAFPEHRKKLVTIENGIGDEFLTIAKNRTYKWDKQVHLLTVSNLIPGKGVDQIIEAVANLPRPSFFKLCVVGDGSELFRLRQMVVQLEIADSVEFLGEVEPDNIPAQFVRADIFILASHSEGRPNVILEAMASGLPVIASNIDGINELVFHEKTGLLFSDNRVSELTARIQTLIEHPDLARQYGREGCSQILKRKLLWGNTANRYFDLFQRANSEQG